jgi:hypothetical protein
MKGNKTMKGLAITNHRRRKDKKVERILIQLHTIKPSTNKDNYMTGITMYLSILTLNANGLNSPIKRYQLANWIKKEDPTIYCL